MCVTLASCARWRPTRAAHAQDVPAVWCTVASSSATPATFCTWSRDRGLSCALQTTNATTEHPTTQRTHTSTTTARKTTTNCRSATWRPNGTRPRRVRLCRAHAQTRTAIWGGGRWSVRRCCVVIVRPHRNCVCVCVCVVGFCDDRTGVVEVRGRPPRLFLRSWNKAGGPFFGFVCLSVGSGFGAIWVA